MFWHCIDTNDAVLSYKGNEASQSGNDDGLKISIETTEHLLQAQL